MPDSRNPLESSTSMLLSTVLGHHRDSRTVASGSGRLVVRLTDTLSL